MTPIDLTKLPEGDRYYIEKCGDVRAYPSRIFIVGTVGVGSTGADEACAADGSTKTDRAGAIAHIKAQGWLTVGDEPAEPASPSPDKLTLADFPDKATYTRGDDVVCCYVEGRCLWTSYEGGNELQRCHSPRSSTEIDITRAEAIAIVRERGQLVEPAIPLDSELAKKGKLLLEAAYEYWKQYKKDVSGASAVVQLTDDSGHFVLFTRGEYREAIMAAAERECAGKAVLFEPFTKPTDEKPVTKTAEYWRGCFESACESDRFVREQVLKNLKVDLRLDPASAAREIRQLLDDMVGACREVGMGDTPAGMSDHQHYVNFIRELGGKTSPVTPKGKYGGPYDDAADEWAEQRGMVVDGYRVPAGDDAWIGGDPYRNSLSSPSTYAGGSDPLAQPRYIVKPKPVTPEPAKWAPRVGDTVTDNLDKERAACTVRHVEVYETGEPEVAIANDDDGLMVRLVSEISPVPTPVIKRWMAKGYEMPIGEYPLISRDGKTDLDRERIGVEWAVKWMESEGVKVGAVGPLSYTLGKLTDRLSAIERGEP